MKTEEADCGEMVTTRITTTTKGHERGKARWFFLKPLEGNNFASILISDFWPPDL